MEFDNQFGLNWSDRLNQPLLKYFSVTFLLVFSVIVIVANLDYSLYQKKSDARILERYKRLVTELITEEDRQLTSADSLISGKESSEHDIPRTTIATAAERENRRNLTDSQMAKRGILKSINKYDPYADLPLLDDNEPEFRPDEFLVVELSRKGASSGMRFQTRRRNVNNYAINEFDEPLKNLYNYVIKRQGNAYINPTKELLRDNQIQFGYRDPDEIQRVIAKYKPMIEHCYRKALSQNGGTSGFVKVQFHISYEGFVIPESIHILNSTINNRQAELCIKKYIKRWRNFEELDEKMGIARVTQKFVFN